MLNRRDVLKASLVAAVSSLAGSVYGLPPAKREPRTFLWLGGNGECTGGFDPKGPPERGDTILVDITTGPIEMVANCRPKSVLARFTFRVTGRVPIPMEGPIDLDAVDWKITEVSDGVRT